MHSGNGSTLHSETVDGGPRAANAAARPTKASPNCVGGGAYEVGRELCDEQHIEKLLKRVEPTHLALGTPDAAALIVLFVRGWANDMARAPKEGQDADVVLPIDLENTFGRAFRSTSLEAARTA